MSDLTRELKRAAPPRKVGMAVEPTRADPRLVGAREIAVGGLLLPAGTRIGQYELIRPLGRGGMGQVYVARDEVLGRRVAIKFLLDTDAAFVARLFAEARATARCQHENIVVIHEIGEHQGYPFLVLEYLEGEGLDAILARSPLSVDRVIELVAPVVRALGHAHAHGIVHRDLKPENVFVTEAGVVKVLDFGIAKAFEEPTTPVAPSAVSSAPLGRHTDPGAIVGTLPYMAPEQLRGGAIDGRADLWAVGVMLHVMLTYRHPLGADVDRQRLREELWDLERPMPSATAAGVELPAELIALIDRCLQKQVEARFPDAQALLAALEPFLPERRAGALGDDVCPYLGLTAFGEADADRFFGRSADLRRALSRLHDHPVLGVIGPSGAGKSSFVRAGLAPTLKRGADPWDVITLRPGRDPIGRLEELVRELGDRGEDALGERLRAEPGHLGALLRHRARSTRRRVILSIDQLEELYTLVAAPEDRAAFLACLSAAADDVAAPVRVVVSMRSDFLDRLTENPDFLAPLTRGLLFLLPIDRAGLREALVRPAKMAGYRFEDEELVEEMVDALELAPGALPLLQFAATRLWDGRDRASRTLTRATYQAMGGVAGAIAAHADQVVAELPPEAHRAMRSMFRRLVTPERTRQVVDQAELVAADAGARELLDHLVRARLLVVSTVGNASTVEIVHESLISSWPALSRVLDEEEELVTFLAQLRGSAKQWDERGRPAGLLWRNEALDDARRLRGRIGERELPRREREYLDAAFALDERSRRSRRLLLSAAVALLALVAAGAMVALVWIRGAEREARRHAEHARDEAERALVAQQRAETEQRQRRAAEDEVKQASVKVEEKDQDLREANRRLARALEEQQREAAHAKDAQHSSEREAARARAAEDDVRQKQRELEVLLKEREARVRQLEERLSQISVKLK